MANRLTRGKGVFGSVAASGPITAASVTQSSVSFTVGTESANTINVAMVFKDGVGVTQAVPKAGMWYLSDVATGLTPSTTAPNSGIAVGTNGKITKWTTNLSGFFVTTAAGLLDLTLSESGTPTFYLVIVMPNGSLSVSGAITFA